MESAEALAAELEAQRREIERLRCRLDAQERRLAASEGASRDDAATVEDADPGAAVTDRRHVLGQVASAAAGALAGGVALALVDAGPAQALPGTFNGNPAVTATGQSGHGVYATTDTAGSLGAAVEGTTSVAIGIGVEGVSNGAAGVGVSAVADDVNGRGVAARSNDGTGVSSTGGQIGVYGVAGKAAATGVKGLATAGDGVRGEATVGNGVHGLVTSAGSGNTAGVRGEGVTFGVIGSTSSGTGVLGSSVMGQPGSTGVYGTGATGVVGFGTTGVYGRGKTNGAVFDCFDDTAKSQLRFDQPLGGMPVPTGRTDAHLAGELAADVNNDVWLCVVAGTPGTWRRVAGPATAGSLVALPTPKRVYDSRPSFPPAVGVKSPLVGGAARLVDLTANGSGVPAGATAVLVSLTVTGTTGAAGGFLAVYRAGIAWPGTSNVNWSGPGQSVAVTTLTAVDAAARCEVYANLGTDVVVDVLGYYR